MQKFGALGNCLLSRNAGYSYREDDVERGIQYAASTMSPNSQSEEGGI
jgi:hypothetical protein